MFQSIKQEIQQVVIVGRPNVGKSTLFNRLIGKRQAITDSRPGVTRDAIRARCDINGEVCQLVDTGGFRIDREEFDDVVIERTKKTIEEANLILLLLDANEYTPEDEAMVELVRPFQEKTMVIVNKVDSEQKEDHIWNYYSLGFEKIIGISAIHNRNIEELQTEIINYLKQHSISVSPEPSPDIRLSIMGKPNTGKSTLLNTLSDSDNAIISPIAGTTRDVIEGWFLYKDLVFQLLDTAGMRRKNRIHDDLEYYSVNRAVESVYNSDIVYLLIDSNEGLTEQDKKIASIAERRGKGFIIILNKWDMLQKIPNMLQAVKDRIKFVFPVVHFAPVIPISAKDQTGIDTLLNTTEKVWKQINRRIETSELNKYLEEWQNAYPVPMVKHRKYKLRYITQASSNPVKFVLFVNRTYKFPKGYLQYLKNRIRKDLGFSMITFDIELRES